MSYLSPKMSESARCRYLRVILIHIFIEKFEILPVTFDKAQEGHHPEYVGFQGDFISGVGNLLKLISLGFAVVWNSRLIHPIEFFFICFFCKITHFSW